MFSNEQDTENVKDSGNKENEESAKNKDSLYQKESFESKISKDDDTNLHIDGLENKMNIDDSEDLSKNINLDEDAQTNTLEKKQSNRKINLFTLGNIIFLVLDVCLPAWDIISDVMVIINYWKRSNFTWNAFNEPFYVDGILLKDNTIYTGFRISQLYSYGFIASVVILLLPSCSYLVDLILMKVYDLKKLSIALAYQPFMVFKGLRCFFNPTNCKMKRDFLMLKIYGTSIESTLQFLLQSGILIFEISYKDPQDFNTSMVILSSVHIHDRAQELISIGTSVISIMYGLCSYKFNICNKNQEPNITKKIKLMLRCSVDLVSRLSVLLSIIIYSLLWKKGLLISILSISIIIVVFPISAAILNNILILKTYFSDRTIIFLPLPVEFTKASEVNKPETINKLILARIRNKTLGILLMIMVILIQVMDIKGLINLTKQEIWFDCHNRTSYINMLLKIVWSIAIPCILISTVEVIQYLITGSHWVQFVFMEFNKMELNNHDPNDLHYSHITNEPHQTTAKSKPKSNQNRLKLMVTILEVFVGLLLISCFLSIISVSLLSSLGKQYSIRAPDNFTHVALVVYEVKDKMERQENICDLMKTESNSVVVHALHLMIAAKMNELAIETISCKIVPTTSITYYDDTFEEYQYHNTLSALHRAMLFNNTEDVSLDLIDAILTYYPEDLYARSDTGSTPLFYATKFPTAFNRLIDAGADVYATTYKGENIFHKLNSTSSEMLKRFPALVNQKSCAGDTPLHKTCEFANEDTIKTLIENGADTEIVNNDGETPTDKCCLQCLIGDCFQKCKFVHGEEPKGDICQYNPVNVLVLEDIYDSDTIRNNTQECCAMCKEKQCLLNCDIIEQGYSSKTLCNSSFKTFLALDEYVAPGVSTLIRNSLSDDRCMKSCTFPEKECMRSKLFLHIWYWKYYAVDKSQVE